MTVRTEIPPMDQGRARREREKEQKERRDNGGGDPYSTIDTPDRGTKPGEATKRKLDFVWADDIEPKITDPGLVDGLLSTVGITVAYGESTAGKTFVVVDLACRIACNMPWRDLEVEPGVVVYIAAEAPKSVERRIWAWKRHHGLEHVPLVVVRSTVNLLSQDTDSILALLADIQSEHGRIALVVIDTLARAMVGNESSSEDMGRYVDACSRMRQEAQTQVLSVHHCGKDTAKGARGWSGLRAATDVELEISEGCILVSKNRDERSGQSYGFKLEQVELGTNRKGRVITTCVALDTDAPKGGGKRHRRGGNEKITLDALAATISDNPQEPPLAPDIPFHVKGTTTEQWKIAALRYLPQEDAKRKGEAFKRSMQALVAGGAVAHVDGFCWVP